MGLATALHERRMSTDQVADRLFAVGHTLAGKSAHMRRALAAYHSANRGPTVSMTRALEAVSGIKAAEVDGRPILYTKTNLEVVIEAIKPKHMSKEKSRDDFRDRRPDDREYDRSDTGQRVGESTSTKAPRAATKATTGPSRFAAQDHPDRPADIDAAARRSR
ncbi:hypothetical protein BCR44DRAFT_1150094 [Catenaria anguillulae PL171]|uniref:Uncharacterized protein n=1 Tax=Catenaria anguillulae PL171 TaxID=765915 RepID=A0A1Y2HLS9_9FUNG|nr:hypothetical protein BCR44DRAFT_1150094 [Catenaria anguillulae PL171]